MVFKQKGKEGDALKYIGRTKAVRKLQISLSQFRRLCILKGIYPVEPKNKRKLSNGATNLRTFYHRKDIQFLLHEPLLQVFRQERVHIRKLNKAIGKREFAVAKALQDNKPIYTLDHILKERYPSFGDALADMDDALSLVSLFATLPVGDHLSADKVSEAQRLCNEFNHFVIQSHSLQKVFLSIKGIYYQAEINNQPITWLVPYQFCQEVPTDVDFKVMRTFLDIYSTLVGFVNFKLYSDFGLSYPPSLDESQPPAKKLKSDQMKSLERKLEEIQSNASDNEQEDVQEDGTSESLLFSSCVFWLSRETPRDSLEFVIKAFGGQMATDDADARITHHISDRPLPNNGYIQPQWVYDCINSQKLLKTEGYLQGDELPPHLSPFVVAREGDYVPGQEIEANENKEQNEEEDEEKQQEVEAVELAKMVMSKRDRHLYNKIHAGKKRKQKQVDVLKQKKVAILNKKKNQK